MTQANPSNEIPLSGGRTNAGIVRIGNTVHRPMRLNSEFVQELLRHLHDNGCTFVPEPLGFDNKGREIVSYIEGDVPSELELYDDETLTNAAQIIRIYHNATRAFLLNSKLEVICHNDLSPCNFVFRNGLPVGIIDFDAAAPGLRVMDLAYAAWLWLDIGNNDINPREQKRRLELFSKAYGMNLTSVLKSIKQRQQMLVPEGQHSGNLAMAKWAKACYEWTNKNLC